MGEMIQQAIINLVLKQLRKEFTKKFKPLEKYVKEPNELDIKIKKLEKRIKKLENRILSIKG